jgi:DNA-binding protein HU-beta
MNRNEMVEGIMRQAGISKANVSRFYDGLVELVRRELVRKKEFVLPGLGVLRVRKRAARMVRNPRTGQMLHVSARKAVRFRAYSALDELLNGPRVKSTEVAAEPTGELPLEDSGQAGQNAGQIQTP